MELGTARQMRRALEVIFEHTENALKRAEYGGDIHAIHEAELAALRHIYSAVVTAIGFPQSEDEDSE